VLLSESMSRALLWRFWVTPEACAGHSSAATRLVGCHNCRWTQMLLEDVFWVFGRICICWVNS
jgi:hypothetical protein